LALRLLLALAAFAVLYGCGQASSSVEKQENKAGVERANKLEEALQPTPDLTTLPSASAEGGVTVVGEAIAEAELRPVSHSSTSGTAVFKEVGHLGIQVELDVSGLPTKNSGAAYYAQVHEGSCSDERRSEGHEEEHSVGLGSALVLVRFDRLVAKGSGAQAHGGHVHGSPEVPPDSIEQPIEFFASADRTASVSSLLEGVEPKRLMSGPPEYVHLHGVDSDDSPQLACGDVVGASRRGSG
jgi:hypothetical protein